jgi:UDPglucose 6-dehydrogenase
VLVLTEWDEFRDLDFAKVYQEMHKPAWIFDGRNVLDMAKLKSLGFYVYSIGKPHSI